VAPVLPRGVTEVADRQAHRWPLAHPIGGWLYVAGSRAGYTSPPSFQPHRLHRTPVYMSSRRSSTAGPSAQFAERSAIVVPNVANTTLIAAVTGIVVSGVVGPSTTAWAARRAARSQFLRDRAAECREELRRLLDEAASVLGLGATRLRQAWEADRAGHQAPELQPWSEQVFMIGQRLRLRLPADDPIVVAYDTVRRNLVTAGELVSQSDAETYEAALRTLRPPAIASWRQAKRRWMLRSKSSKIADREPGQFPDH